MGNQKSKDVALCGVAELRQSPLWAKDKAGGGPRMPFQTLPAAGGLQSWRPAQDLYRNAELF